MHWRHKKCIGLGRNGPPDHNANFFFFFPAHNLGNPLPLKSNKRRPRRKPPVSLPWISSPSVLFGYLCLVDGWTALPSCRAALISATYGRSTPTALRLSRQHGSAVWLSKCVSPEGKLNSSKECGGVCVCECVLYIYIVCIYIYI